MAEVEELSESKCRQLLGGGVFGRIGLWTPDGPVIVPVNYSLVSESVVFRTAADGVVAHHDWSSPMAFQVDHVDYADQKVWSVLVVGKAQPVVDADELALILRTWDPRPWAAGARPLHVRVTWDRLTGRRLGSGWNYGNEMPVRRHV
jgi:nitroimidazol reductase NimA-like FMN-containing flavoprotein (pyridoxamine 5'-phosphate oxidase superfamily)